MLGAICAEWFLIWGTAACGFSYRVKGGLLAAWAHEIQGASNLTSTLSCWVLEQQLLRAVRPFFCKASLRSLKWHVLHLPAG